MMYLASIEISKNLFAASGWDDCRWCFRDVSDTKTPHWKTDLHGLEHEHCFPQYDLGYLLRKLPTKSKGIYAHSTISDHKRTPEHQEYYAVWECEDGDYFDFYADTPEDAVAKLCIELFKSGVLT